MTDIKLELLTDIDMLLFIEQGLRGGISQISHRYAKANNPEAPDYNSNQPNSFIMYWDANNLYGWAMSQYLPYGGFEWQDPIYFNIQKILNLDDNDANGYIFEADLDYPVHLHHLHNDYPLAPEKLIVTEEMLSPYARSLLDDEKYIGTSKLIPNLNHKRKYIVHYRNLKLYLQLGLELTKIHKVLKFKQAPWLQQYIQFNTEKRKQATSTFEKDFFKLMNNSIYGKTMENLRKRRNIALCNSEKRAQKIVANPNYKNFKQFEHDLVAVERIKGKIYMNRPIYVGFAILELSKVLMYQFHYQHIKKTYQDNATLLFTDTDSLCYYIQTENINEDMKQHATLFDFSDYPIDHPLHSNNNKKVLGKFKDELNGEIAYEFVGIKAKMYSLLSEKCEKKRAKGVSTRIVNKKLTHENFKTCILEEKLTYEMNKRIDQQSHKLHTIAQNKKCLSPFDDKRYLKTDGISSLAYGHCDIAMHT